MSEIKIHPTKSIPAFYAGQSIFLTGATGFLGKIFIEKILRSCPDVREIFILMRPKKKLSIDERLEKMLSLPLFEKLRKEQLKESLKKLIPVTGDISAKGLGLSAADRQMLTDKVTIVVHAAASVRFDDNLKYSIFVNTRSTRDICILAESMKNLLALVYISTTYSQSDKPIVEEKIYPSFTDWRKMINVAESLDDHTLNIFTAKYMNNIRNTYIFSKNLAEAIIEEYSSSLPCAILRPSVVIATVKEPMPGWVDSLYGPISLFIGGGKGILRVTYVDRSVNADYVPADFVIKALIILAWKLGTTSPKPDSALVLHCSSSDLKSLSNQEVIKLSFDCVKDIPLEGVIWTLDTIMTANYVMYYVLVILLHMLPAIFIDLVLWLLGYKPMLVKLQRKIFITSVALGHFTCNEWTFKSTKCLLEMDSIPPESREEFLFNVSNIDIKDHLKNCLRGCKKYLLNEDLNRMDEAKVHCKRVNLFVIIFKTLVAIGILWLAYKWM